MRTDDEKRSQEFRTATGICVPAVTAAQMREIDRICLEETGPNLYQMMENAGRNLAQLALEKVGADWYAAEFLVLAGSGGNGGGGICAARHLANRGAGVKLCLAAPDRLAQVPAFQRKVFASTPGEEITPDQLDSLRPTLILDALLGYSLRGAPRDPHAAIIRWANHAGAPILALDLPSGLDATTGETPGEFVRATCTLTLALPKTGLTHSCTGQLILADIGIPPAVFARLGLPYTQPFGPRSRLPLRAPA
jgi:NAD(P)H-hydrate epimerase